MNKWNLQLFAEEGQEAVCETEAVEPVQGAEAEQPQWRYQALEPVLDAMAQRLGVEGGQALLDAVKQRGDAAQARRRDDRVERIYSGWMQQAQQLKQLYPGFDLGAELHNPRFVRLLRSRVDMQTAYETAHHDQLLPAAMEYAARTVEARLISALGSGYGRPVENGIRDSGAFVMGSDVAGMTKEEIARMCRRVEKGERVSFG